MTLRSGHTTGTCAAAAAKAAILMLDKGKKSSEAAITLPGGGCVTLPIEYVKLSSRGAVAAVIKDAGDDPDITNNATVEVGIQWDKGNAVTFAAGEGVGTVTKSGLQIPAGEPAINPVPRRMISEVIRRHTHRGVKVTVSVPGGARVAKKTFNPRLGIVGGISILGTTGIVKPFSCEALRKSLVCAVDIAKAAGVRYPVLVPGNIGEKAARRHLDLTPEQVILVSNEWGFMLDYVVENKYDRLLAAGHPGKLAKLANGDWDTHSSRSQSAAKYIQSLAERVFGRTLSDSPTTEGLFMELSAERRRLLGNAAATAIRKAIMKKTNIDNATVLLVNMKTEILGFNGDLSPWQ